MGTLSVLSTTTEAMVADRSRFQGGKERVAGRGTGSHEYGSIGILSLRKILDVRDSKRKDQLWLQSGRFPSLVIWPHGFGAFREAMSRENDFCRVSQKTKGERKKLESQFLEGHLPHGLLSRMILPVWHDQNNLEHKFLICP